MVELKFKKTMYARDACLPSPSYDFDPIIPDVIIEDLNGSATFAHNNSFSFDEAMDAKNWLNTLDEKERVLLTELASQAAEEDDFSRYGRTVSPNGPVTFYNEGSGYEPAVPSFTSPVPCDNRTLAQINSQMPFGSPPAIVSMGYESFTIDSNSPFAATDFPGNYGYQPINFSGGNVQDFVSLEVPRPPSRNVHYPDTHDVATKRRMSLESAGSSNASKKSRSRRSSSGSTASKAKARQWWEYNVSHKGPKLEALEQNHALEIMKSSNPHILPQREDPVFDDEIADVTRRVLGYSVKHAGRARIGDGNDLHPRPDKMRLMQKQVEELETAIDTLAVQASDPLDLKTQKRKEKNKLASRVCRVKRKAQHEANKIMLNGLEMEHHEKSDLVARALKLIRDAEKSGNMNDLLTRYKHLVAALNPTQVGRDPRGYVNDVLAGKQTVPDI